MGLILDSSAAVAAERGGRNAKRLLQDVFFRTGDNDVAISAITVLEMAHGLARADSPERRERRQRFLDQLISVVPVHSVTTTTALRAGAIDGQSQSKGIRIPLGDLLIGSTALELGYSVGTHNVRHFQLIPGLNVIQL